MALDIFFGFLFVSFLSCHGLVLFSNCMLQTSNSMLSGFGRSRNQEYVLFLDILEGCLDDPHNKELKVQVT